MELRRDRHNSSVVQRAVVEGMLTIAAALSFVLILIHGSNEGRTRSETPNSSLKKPLDCRPLCLSFSLVSGVARAGFPPQRVSPLDTILKLKLFNLHSRGRRIV